MPRRALSFPLLCVLLLMASISPRAAIARQVNFEAEYNRLRALVDEHEPEPRGNPSFLEPYLQAMELKAQDRDQVDSLLQQLNVLSHQSPNDEEIAALMSKFFLLRERAQESGNGTVREAGMKFMRWGSGTLNDDWRTATAVLQRDGRRIYLKAQETGFDTFDTLERAKCMLRFSYTDIEFGDTAIWVDRDAFLGGYDQQGFQVLPQVIADDMCMRRNETTVTDEGRPGFPMADALEDTKLIRDEAEWWQLDGERQDVVDLENDYYEDALCEQPPHQGKLGHDYFRDLAEEHELDESVEHNEGFYGTLYGIVEVEMPDGRQPAPNARVTVKSGDESWTATADDEGNYEIADIILHDDCSPHDISAEYEGDRTDDTYDGPLEEPEEGARHRKDLLIIPSAVWVWTGTLDMGTNQEQHCDVSVEERGAHSSLSEHRTHAQTVSAQIYGNAVDLPGALSIGMSRDMNVTGELTMRISTTREHRAESADGGTKILERDMQRGWQSHPLTTDNVLVTMMGGMPPSRPEYTIDVTVVVQVFSAGLTPVQVTQFRQVTDRGETRTERDNQNLQQVPPLPMRLIMAGQYTRRRDGSATLTAGDGGSEPMTYGGTWDCPDGQAFYRGTLRLQRRREGGR